MKRKLYNFSRLYQDALQIHLKQGRRASLKAAHDLGFEARAIGFQTLDLVKMHEETMLTNLLPLGPPSRRAVIIKRAGVFFTETILPMESSNLSEKGLLKEIVETLSQRTIQLAAANLELNQEIVLRMEAEEFLQKSAIQGKTVQEQSRRLSHQILSAQEKERKKISTDLDEQIVQTLTGINLRLTTLKKEVRINPERFEQKITQTQRLIDQAMKRIHRTALELRPTVLDDIGLIPALHSFMKNFTRKTGIITRLNTCSEVELLSMTRRTVLFRVAQEALGNVARHSKASHAGIDIQKTATGICMKIWDDGKSLSAERAWHKIGKQSNELLGMRERLEMVLGNFTIESIPGKGTTQIALIPTGQSVQRKKPQNSKSL